MNKFFVAGMVVSLLSLVALAEESPEEVIEGEGEVVEPVTPPPVRYTATILPGGTKTYTNPQYWDTGKVPDGYHVDVVIDNDPTQNTTVNFNLQNANCTNGFIRFDEGDKLNIATGYSGGGTTLRLFGTCVTNFGEIAFGSVKKNGQNYYLDARLEPSYNGLTGKIKIDSPNYQGYSHRMNWLLDGSVNDGEILLTSSGAQYQYSGLNLEGGGTFTNNGTITMKVTGGYSNNKPGASEFGLYGGDVQLAGTGTIRLDCSTRPVTGTQNPWIRVSGLDYKMENGVTHTIVGEGLIDNATVINKGLIKSEGAVRSLDCRLQCYRNAQAIGGVRMSMTNDVTGRIVAASTNGILFSYNSRPNWNARFINLGLLEARTECKIAFANGINTTSTKTSDGDLNNFDTDYLELWGRIAGGGRFVTPRRIYIGDGARLMPGDLANTDGTGESTCGTITFPRLVLREPAAIPDSEETTSGAITEFQCRKPEAGKYDSVWVNGDATVAGTLRFLRQPKAGTYPLFTSTGTLTCDLSALKIDLADGVKAPKLRLNTAATYTVEEPVLDEVSGEPVLDEETGLPKTQTVEMPCQRLEATWVGGFTVFVR